MNSIFQSDWWLQAVAPNAWGAAQVTKGNEVVARLPYVLHRRRGLTTVTMPPLTQYLGPWFRPTSAKVAKAVGQQRELVDELIHQLPEHDYFGQAFHGSITNWLPFYWHGFDQTTRYTYVLDDLDDLDVVWSGCLENIRRDVRKAESQLEVRHDLGLDALLDVNALSFRRLGRALPYSRDVARRVDAACEERQCRRMFFAVDGQGRTHATLYIVWGVGTTHYVMGGADPDLRKSGANSLLMWEAIKFASTVSTRFDFEGSMIDAVERFVRAFGGRQVGYSFVTRTSRRMRALVALRELAQFGRTQRRRP